MKKQKKALEKKLDKIKCMIQPDHYLDGGPAFPVKGEAVDFLSFLEKLKPIQAPSLTTMPEMKYYSDGGPMPYIKEGEGTSASPYLIREEKTAYKDEELTEAEQDILYEKLQSLDRLMSSYSDGDPAIPPWITKLTKYYSAIERREKSKEGSKN